MSRTLNMPELAESVVEGEIVQWLVAEGQSVAEDEPLVEVMTDKVTVEIPSPMAGVLEKHLAAEGDVVPVGGPLARFADEGAATGDAGTGAEGASDEGAGVGDAVSRARGGVDDGVGDGVAATADATADSEGEAAAATEGGPSAPAAPPEGAGGARAAAEEADDGSSLTLFKAGPDTDTGPLPRVRKPDGAGASRGAPAAGADGPAGAPATAGAPRGPWGRPLAVPAARKRARELGVPLEQVEGSGPHGRIRVHDVEGHVGGAGAPGGAAGATAPGAAAGGAGADGGGAGAGAALPPYRGAPLGAAPEGPEEVREPFRGMRRRIAQQMMRSHLETVRTLHVDEADVTRLVELRARLKPRAARRGVALSYLPFVMKAVTHALAAYPMLNARLDEDAGEVVRSRDVHLGMAVATERGLLVPVVRDASRRTTLDLGAEVARLAAGARDGTLSPDELRGGTFSVTNIGSIGGLFSFPIINAPEAAILGVHSIKKRPVVLDDDTIVARSMLYLSLSFDHRLVDGAEAALFTRHLIDLLEEPDAMLLDA